MVSGGKVMLLDHRQGSRQDGRAVRQRAGSPGSGQGAAASARPPFRPGVGAHLLLVADRLRDRCRRRRRRRRPPGPGRLRGRLEPAVLGGCRPRRRLADPPGCDRRLLRAGLRHRERRVPPRRPGRIRAARAGELPVLRGAAGPEPHLRRRRHPGPDRGHAAGPLRRPHQAGPSARQGKCTKRVVVVGRGGAVLELVEQLQRQHYAGLQRRRRVRHARPTGSA